jgi:AcrR family transcriptional regulator
MTVFEPLPRGRHKLTSEEVLASQRGRLLQAMLECVGEAGYAATTVPQVVATARVSRNGFYALFADKTECFLALCDQLAGELLREMYALADEPDWRRSVDLGTHAYLSWWQNRPAFARAYLVEVPSAGPRALTQRTAQLHAFAELFAALAARARSEDAALAPLNPLATRLLVHGITELVATEVREGRTQTLEELHDDIVALVCGVLG